MTRGQHNVKQLLVKQQKRRQERRREMRDRTEKLGKHKGKDYDLI